VITAALIGRAVALNAGREAADALLRGDTRSFNIGAVPAFVLTFAIVFVIFELIAMAYARKRWLGIILLIAPPLLFLAYVVGLIGYNESLSVRAAKPAMAIVGTAPPRPALLPPVDMDEHFRRDHPALQYGDNAFLFENAMLSTRIAETKSTTMVASLMSYQDLMEKGYSDAQSDPRWVTSRSTATSNGAMRADWEPVSSSFAANHPALQNGEDRMIFKEKYDHEDSSLSTQELLEKSYQEATADPRWVDVR
jgi:hypothetical protein